MRIFFIPLYLKKQRYSQAQVNSEVSIPPYMLVNLSDPQFLFCLLFSMIFNAKSALFLNQPLILPQKIDSRGGLF